jgi:2-dehydro-3-deoxyglucarate aldolase/4-hydroxy-2-oxoheptanedioate aldolase
MNPLKARVLRGEKLVGTIVSLLDSANVEIFGTLGYDFVWIDMEHTAIGYPEALSHMNACRASCTSALVRVPQNDLTATKKILDMGPEGIVFPMVRSAEEASALIEMTLYPPRGTRGFGPMRAIGYGDTDAKAYTDEGHLDLCRFIQIEHIDCIRALPEIVKNPYIDGYIFGPNDLSGSLGCMGEPFSDKVTDAINEAIAILRAHGKYIGLAVGHSRESLAHWSRFDVDMITAGADWNFLYELGKKNLANLRAFHKGEIK